MSRFNRSDKIVLAAYAVLGLGALIGTQLALVDFLRQDDNGGLTGFLDDTVANPAATLIAVDVTFVALVGALFMLVEGYRLGMRRLWVYVLLTFGVAISVALPLFLLMRHLRLSTPSKPVGEPALSEA